MVEQRQDNNSVLQHFWSWEKSDSTLRNGYGGLDDEEQAKYVPLTALRSYFDKPDRTKNLLKALFKDDEAPAPLYVQSNHLRLFAILLSIGHGYMINHFVEYDSLGDKQLPFHQRPANFPDIPSCDLWDLFYKRQWKYCPVELTYNMSKRLIKNAILPIRVECELGCGGSAKTYKIHVDEGYNRRSHHADHHATNEPPTTHTFVLKRYRGQREAETNYKIERDAFTRLRSDNRLPPNIIGFHGGFIQGDTYNIILEYAELGTLTAFMQRYDPPSSGEDIIMFWERLFELKKSLHTVHESRGSNGEPHVMLGWHQDVKPDNILIKSRNGDSIYDCDIVLADFGNSHFKTIRPYQQDVSDRDAHGTYAYGESPWFCVSLNHPAYIDSSGAPETHRIGHKFSDLRLSVKQNVDIWSLGCVCSVVATWITHGWRKVEEYQLQRRKEVARKLTPEDGDLFHDGENPLDVVHSSHENIKLSRRAGDFISVKVLDLVTKEMLIEADFRLSAKQLYRKGQIIIKEAREELERYRNAASSPESQEHAWVRSSIVPLAGPIDFDPQRGPSLPPHRDQHGDNHVIDHRISSEANGDRHLYLPPTEVSHVPPLGKGKAKEREEPPVLSIEDALELRRNKKGRMNGLLPDGSLLEDLMNRDNIFIIDNTASMSEHKSKARKVLEAMSYLAKKYDPDGVDIVFTKSRQEMNRKKKTESLLKAFDKAEFTGKSDMRVKLGGILEDYKGRITGQQQSTSFLGRLWTQRTHRRLSIYVLTDGKWQPGCDVETTIRSVVTFLKDHNLLDKQIGIQFIRFGDDEDVKHRFDDLDSGLNIDLDIVDTTPAEGGNVLKMLLGPVNTWFDYHDDVNLRTFSTLSMSQMAPIHNSPPTTRGTSR